MKTFIKKSIIALICLIGLQTQVMADNDKPINITQLPATAQQIIKSNFASKKVALAKMESGLLDKSYDVIFTTGEKIEFDRKGNWTEVDCRSGKVGSGTNSKLCKGQLYRQQDSQD